MVCLARFAGCGRGWALLGVGVGGDGGLEDLGDGKGVDGWVCVQGVVCRS